MKIRMTVVRGPYRVRTANSATATAAEDTRCAQAKRDRSNSSPPPPSQWSPWSRVLQRTPLSCPAGVRNGSSHATLSSAADSFPRWCFRKIRGTAKRGIHVPPTAMDAKVITSYDVQFFHLVANDLRRRPLYIRIGIDMSIDLKILLASSPSGGVRVRASVVQVVYIAYTAVSVGIPCIFSCEISKGGEIITYHQKKNLGSSRFKNLVSPHIIMV